MIKYLTIFILFCAYPSNVYSMGSLHKPSASPSLDSSAKAIKQTEHEITASFKELEDLIAKHLAEIKRKLATFDEQLKHTQELTPESHKESLIHAQELRSLLNECLEGHSDLLESPEAFSAASMLLQQADTKSKK